MNFKEILELIDKVADRGLAALEIEQAGTKLRIEGKNRSPQVIHHSYAPDGTAPEMQAIPMAHAPAPPASGAATAVAAGAEAGDDGDAGLYVITSPIVGTFYRSANPESPAFINIGDRMTKGKVLCIIEAMKLMNEIESDVEGILMRVYPQNGQPIEYGEKLFAVKL